MMPSARRAHTDELDENDYHSCAQMVLGTPGLLWEPLWPTAAVKEEI
jgi:hypothetical protein